MKFTLTFKTPDVLDQIADQIPYEDRFEEYGVESQEMEKCKELAERYVRYGEYINVYFDTETGKVYVQPL